MDRAGVRNIPVGPLRDGDAPGGQEVAHPVRAWLPVNVAFVVRARIERGEGRPAPGALFLEKPVKGLLPSRGMDRGGLRQDPVKVKEPGVIGAKIHCRALAPFGVRGVHGVSFRAVLLPCSLRGSGSRPAGWVGRPASPDSSRDGGVGRDAGSFVTVTFAPK